MMPLVMSNLRRRSACWRYYLQHRFMLLRSYCQDLREYVILGMCGEAVIDRGVDLKSAWGNSFAALRQPPYCIVCYHMQRHMQRHMHIIK